MFRTPLFKVIPIPSRARVAHIHLQDPIIDFLAEEVLASSFRFGSAPNNASSETSRSLGCCSTPSYPVIQWVIADEQILTNTPPPDGWGIYGMNEYDLQYAGGRCIVPTNATHLLIGSFFRITPTVNSVRSIFSFQAHVTWELEL